MFEYDPKKLDSVAAKINDLIASEFLTRDGKPDYFASHAVIAKLLGPYDQNVGWVLDHYYASKIAPLVPSLVKLHDALQQHGHDQNNAYEINAGDRFAASVAYGDKGARVMSFCNQNVTYVMVLVPDTAWVNDDNDELSTGSKVGAYTMHVRIITSSPRSQEFTQIDLDKLNYEKILKGCDNERYDNTASEYFRYQDCRDRGYVMTLEPEVFSKFNDVFYKTERMYDNHYMSRYIMEELQCHCSILKETLEEMSNKA